jgi:poly(3-hydroxybutyrate) depolymerase
MQFSGTDVALFVGERQEDQKGPVLFYWHGTGSVKEEASVFMAAQIDEIVAQGGIVASFSTSLGTGDYTGPFVWYSDDMKMADQILACAVEQLNIDTRRIYSAGCSAGGLQTAAMLYRRSSYIAGAMPNSGGIGEPTPPLEDPSHVPSLITTHGAEGSDVVVIDFSIYSGVLDNDIAAKGGFVVDCNHGGGHCGATPEVVAAQWQFLKDHPFGVQADPYAGGLPASFPSYCQVIQ